MPRPALLAVSHGTSDAAGASAIALLVRRVAERLQGAAEQQPVAVHAGFVDVQQPDVATALAAIAGPVVVVPLLLSQGFHVRVDLGRAAAERADAIVTDPLGPDPRLAEVLARRLAEVGAEVRADPEARIDTGALAETHAEDAPEARADTGSLAGRNTGAAPEIGTAAGATAGVADLPVVLAVAGSRDPRSLPDAEDAAVLLGARLGCSVVPAYLAAREPDLATAVAAHPGSPVATYLLAHGYFFDVARRVAGSALLTEPLLDGGDPPAPLVDLVIDRYLAGAAQLAAPSVPREH